MGLHPGRCSLFIFRRRSILHGLHRHRSVCRSKQRPGAQENSNQWMDEVRSQALAGKVNFAGHYVLHREGCGGSTMCVEVLDAQAGEVATGQPNANDGNLLTLSYQPDSNLIIVSGITANTEEDMKGKRLKNRDRTRYYEFVNNEFRLLKITDS
jgi:hypothetical protein